MAPIPMAPLDINAPLRPIIMAEDASSTPKQCQASAVQGKGIAVAVQQLCSLDVQTACHAACVVANLAACNQVHFHDSLQQAGALAPLVELLKCSLDEQSAALGALRNLSSDTLWQVFPKMPPMGFMWSRYHVQPGSVL